MSSVRCFRFGPHAFTTVDRPARISGKESCSPGPRLSFNSSGHRQSEHGQNQPAERCGIELTDGRSYLSQRTIGETESVRVGRRTLIWNAVDR